jgi:hypothetical protein
MAKITRYTGNLKAFGSESLGTERTVFGGTVQDDTLNANITLDYLRGWGVVGVNENPTKQDFNGLAYTLGQLIAYLHQVGVPEWDSLQEYNIGSVTNISGTVYKSLTNANIGNDPATDDVNWGFPLGSSIANTPAGNIAATTVQAAINELDAEKVPLTKKDASGGYAGLTQFKINFKNAAITFTSFLTNSATAAREYAFPDKSGTVALTSDLTDKYDPDNVLGTVSQTAGVPTGALMEYGSNANGEYWKYAGGMLVCRHRSNTNTDGIYVWTYPPHYVYP